MIDKVGIFAMGTWGTGPFENDTAADFAGDLDELAPEDRGGHIRAALLRVVEEPEYVEAPDADEALAAAALVAAGLPGGDPVHPVYGPEEPVPTLPADCQALAVRAIDRILAPESELADLWVDAGDADEWRVVLARMRAVLGEGAPVPR
ncbi:DUF4259 domain-containing protein [Streptomyces sp. NPDC057445]|uniref:DUF4259 domain-containing protein n=1 Tax=Streptomyces sp. NPDC057445 TaxID=3346136 RepID=UPI00369DC982